MRVDLGERNLENVAAFFKVNGAVVSVRTKGDKIGMWLGDSNVGESIITVGKKVKERLNIEAQVRNSNQMSTFAI